MATNKPDSLEARIAELERVVHELATSPRAGNTSIGEGGLRVRAGGAIRSAEFDGVDLDAPGDDGWWLGPDGIVVNRAVIRTGQHTVVAHAPVEVEPIAPSLNDTETVHASLSLPVPDWATSAQVVAWAEYTAVINAIGAGIATGARMRVRVAGQDSPMARQSLSGEPDVNMREGTLPASMGRHLTTLGSTVTCQLRAWQTSPTAPCVIVAGGITVLAMFSD